MGDRLQGSAGLANRWAFVAAAAASCIANATWWLQPVLMHDLVTGRAFGEAEAGLVISIEMAAMAGVSAIMARLTIGQSLRALAVIGIGLAILASVLSLLPLPYPGLLAVRAVAGAGMGASLLLSNLVGALFADPDKAFARMGVINLLFGTIMLGALPYVSVEAVASAAYLMLLLALIVLLAPTFLLPGEIVIPARRTPDDAMGSRQTLSLRITLLILVTFAIGITTGMVWAFVGLIGDAAGLSSTAIEHAISIAILTAILGVALASVIGSRFGRVWPIGIALTLITIAIFVMCNRPDALTFRIALCAEVAAIYFLVPYLFGAAAAQDETGRGVAFVGSAYFATGAISPALGGAVAASIGLEAVALALLITSIASMAVIIGLERAGRSGRSAPDAPPVASAARQMPIMTGDGDA